MAFFKKPWPCALSCKLYWSISQYTLYGYIFYTESLYKIECASNETRLRYSMDYFLPAEGVPWGAGVE